MVSTVRELNERGVVRTAQRGRAGAVPIPTWRWLATFAVVLAVLHDRSTPDTLLAEALASSALVPLDAMFELGPILLLGLLGVALFQLLEDQRRVAVYDQVSRHVVTYALLSVLSITTLRHDNIVLTAALLSASALIAGAAYVRVRAQIAEGLAMRWIGLPFTLALGFSATLAIAAIDAAVGSTAVAIAACAMLALIAIRLCLRFHEAVLPAIVGWALIAICAANRSTTELAGIAFLGGAACVASAIVVAFTWWSTPAPVVRAGRARR